MNLKKTWVAIPAMNESSHIADVVKRTKKICPNVIVIDDGSWDGTGKVAEKAGADVLTHIVNMGKGAALKTGFDYAIRKKAKYLVAIDADGQHRPEEIPRLIKKLDNYGIVFGARTFRKNMPFVLKLGNKFINFMTTILFGIKLRDTQSGFRAMNVESYKKTRWEATDYSMESEMIANAGKFKIPYAEVTISTIYSDKYKGTTVMDGIKIITNLIQWRLRQ